MGRIELVLKTEFFIENNQTGESFNIRIMD